MEKEYLKIMIALTSEIDNKIKELKNKIKDFETIKNKIINDFDLIKKEYKSCSDFDYESVYISQGGSAYIRFKEKNTHNKKYVFRFSTHKHKKNGSAILRNYIYGD